MLGYLDGTGGDGEVRCGALPTGTLTFLFTDVEGSTELWNRDVAAMSTALAAHDALLLEAVESHGGHVFKHTGDGVHAVFTTARAAVEAAVEARDGLELAVRMGVDTGEAELRGGDYFGSTPNRVARIMDAGNGGQIVLSEATAALAPELELIDLGEHQLRGFDAPTRLFQLGVGDFGELRTPRHGVGSLPVQLTSFVGRDDDIRTVVTALGKHRLVTLVGVGGVGKSRLALAAVDTAAPQFADGSRFVDLAPVSVAEAVPMAFAAGLGFRSAAQGDVMATVVARLRDMRLIVVVDNCEHVRAAAATAAEEIVRGCPGTVVLATSREPLLVRGEQLIPVVPVPLRDARALFIERAGSEAPDLEFDDAQLAATDELCIRLDGLPLAIELAASRVRTFSPVELAARLDERFRVLVGGRRTQNRRHETLRSALDWSYELCDPTERLVFERLAIFQSAFNLQTAVAVAVDDDLHEADVIDAVARLIDRSMLQHLIGPGGSSRYRLLETVRAYGRERLERRGETDAARERHALGIAALMTRLALSTLGPVERLARDEITLLVPDCRAALEWFVEQRDWDGAVRVATFGISNSRREEQELTDLLVDAIHTSGEHPIVLAELRSTEQELTLPSDEWNKLALDDINAGWRPPVDRFSYSPHFYLENFGLSDRGRDPLLRQVLANSLSTFDAAPLRLVPSPSGG